MEEIIEQVTTLNQFILSRLHTAVMTAIDEAGMDAGSSPKLKEIFDPNGQYGKPFKDLETSYRQL